MPPEEEVSPEFAALTRLASNAEELAQYMREMERVTQELMRTFGIPMSETYQVLSQAMRTDMPDVELPNPYWSEPGIPDPYVELTGRVRRSDPRVPLLPPLRHDVRAASIGNCWHCSEESIALCFTIGCHQQGRKLCAKHLHEEHDERTLPEGVPHE